MLKTLIRMTKQALFTAIRKVVIDPLSRRGLGKVRWIHAVYRFIVARLTPEGEWRVRINDCDMIVKLGGNRCVDGVGPFLLFDGEYEPQTTAVFKALIKPRMKVADIGANIGYFTVLAGRLVGPKGRVWAFEPEQKNFDDLCENIRLNKLENTTPIQKAVSGKKGKATLHLSKATSGGHSLIPCYSHHKGIARVETTSLDSVIKGEVDIVKTDTEGNELEVLRGARGLLVRCNGVKLFVEFDSQVARYSVRELWDLLAKYGFRYMYLLDERRKRTELVTLKRVEQYSKQYGGTNVLCSKKKVEELAGE